MRGGRSQQQAAGQDNACSGLLRHPGLRVSEVCAWSDTQVCGLYRRAALLAEEHTKQWWVAPVSHEWAGSVQVVFRERFDGWNTPTTAVHQPGAAQRPSAA